VVEPAPLLHSESTGLTLTLVVLPALVVPLFGPTDAQGPLPAFSTALAVHAMLDDVVLEIWNAPGCAWPPESQVGLAVALAEKSPREGGGGGGVGDGVGDGFGEADGDGLGDGLGDVPEVAGAEGRRGAGEVVTWGTPAAGELEAAVVAAAWADAEPDGEEDEAAVGEPDGRAEVCVPGDGAPVEPSPESSVG